MSTDIESALVRDEDQEPLQAQDPASLLRGFDPAKVAIQASDNLEMMNQLKTFAKDLFEYLVLAEGKLSSSQQQQQNVAQLPVSRGENEEAEDDEPLKPAAVAAKAKATGIVPKEPPKDPLVGAAKASLNNSTAVVSPEETRKAGIGSQLLSKKSSSEKASNKQYAGPKRHPFATTKTPPVSALKDKDATRSYAAAPNNNSDQQLKKKAPKPKEFRGQPKAADGPGKSMTLSPTTQRRSAQPTATQQTLQPAVKEEPTIDTFQGQGPSTPATRTSPDHPGENSLARQNGTTKRKNFGSGQKEIKGNNGIRENTNIGGAVAVANPTRSSTGHAAAVTPPPAVVSSSARFTSPHKHPLDANEGTSQSPIILLDEETPPPSPKNSRKLTTLQAQLGGMPTLEIPAPSQKRRHMPTKRYRPEENIVTSTKKARGVMNKTWVEEHLLNEDQASRRRSSEIDNEDSDDPEWEDLDESESEYEEDEKGNDKEQPIGPFRKLTTSNIGIKDTKMQFSVGLTRAVLNEHRKELRLLKSGRTVLSSKDGKLSHMILNSEWNDLPLSTDSDDGNLKWHLGKGKARLQKVQRLDPSKHQQQPLPIFWAEQQAKGRSLCHYLGHFKCIRFEAGLRVIYKKEAQAILEFQFCSFEKAFHEKLTDIASNGHVETKEMDSC